MANIDQFLQRNKDFAATGADDGRQHHREAPGLVSGSRLSSRRHL